MVLAEEYCSEPPAKDEAAGAVERACAACIDLAARERRRAGVAVGAGEHENPASDLDDVAAAGDGGGKGVGVGAVENQFRVLSMMPPMTLPLLSPLPI